MKRAIIALVLAFGLCLPAAAQGPIVYSHELEAQDSGILFSGQVIPGIGEQRGNGTFHNTDGSIDVFQFMGDRGFNPLAGHTCTSTLCWWASFHFTEVEIAPPEPVGPFGWTDAPLVKEYDANVTATSLWAGRWVLVTVTNSVTMPPLRDILILIMAILIGVKATRIIRRYLAPEVLHEEQTNAPTQGTPNIPGSGIAIDIHHGSSPVGDTEREGRE